MSSSTPPMIARRGDRVEQARKVEVQRDQQEAERDDRDDSADDAQNPAPDPMADAPLQLGKRERKPNRAGELEHVNDPPPT